MGSFLNLIVIPDASKLPPSPPPPPPTNVNSIFLIVTMLGQGRVEWVGSFSYLWLHSLQIF